MHTDRCGNTCRQKCCAKESGKEVKIQEFLFRDTANVEPEMYEGNSISKLQIVIENNRMEIMTYKQHLFFNIISIQI